jgi:hypothetical protein
VTIGLMMFLWEPGQDVCSDDAAADAGRNQPKKELPVDIPIPGMRRARNRCRRYLGRMDGCARDGGREPGGDQSRGCNDAECHSQRAINDLRAETDRDQYQVPEFH